MRIEAGGDDHELRSEGVRGGKDPVGERAVVLLVPGSGRHRAVDGGAGTAADSGLGCGPSAGVVRKLVDAGIHH